MKKESGMSKERKERRMLSQIWCYRHAIGRNEGDRVDKRCTDCDRMPWERAKHLQEKQTADISMNIPAKN